MQHCNICGASDWTDFAGRVGIRCSNCGSLERTRLMKLHLEKRGVTFENKNIFHCAPEAGLCREISKSKPADYMAVDLFPEIYKFYKVRKFDLCLDTRNLQREYFDLILHNHVLEHIPCDVTATFYYLHRSLKADGLHCFSLPLSAVHHYEEYLGPLSAEEKTKRFGQRDHVRWFSIADFSATIGMVFDLVLDDWRPIRQFSEQELSQINFPERNWDLVDGSTVFVCTKADLLLQ